MATRGRKEKYTTHVKPYLKDITKWIRKGEPEYIIFEKLGVSETRWYEYKKNKRELREAIKRGEQHLTKHVESMLYKKCSGYEVEETKTLIEKDGKGKEKKKIEKITKHIIPSDTSIIFFLKNKDPENWKDRQEFKGDINQKIQNIVIDIEEEE